MTEEQWIAVFGNEICSFFPKEESHPDLFVRGTFENVIVGIKHGDRIAIKIAIALFQQDGKMSFGKPIKCGIAKALREKKNLLDASQLEVIEQLIQKLQALTYPPAELKHIRRILEAEPAEL